MVLADENDETLGGSGVRGGTVALCQSHSCGIIMY